MGVGGSHSQNRGNSSSNSNGGGSRGRSYMMILVLAFGAALLGVMILHKLRERRIFNLLLKDKDHQLLSLHLLLQKERDRVRELKTKNEEMKAKIYSLRNKKMEFDRRFLEMQSTIDSLKDEQRTMEVAVEEKQNEIKMLHLKDMAATETGNSQVTELIESLKQKDAEIEDLKNRLQHLAKTRSDEPSNLPANMTTMTGNLVGKEQTSEVDEKTVTSEKLTNSQDQTIKDAGSSRKKQEQGNKSEGFKDGNEEKSIVQRETTSDNGGSGVDLKTVDERSYITTVKEEPGKFENAQVQGQTLVKHSNGGMKLDRQENSDNIAWPTKRSKRGSLGKTNGRRWRLIAKNRRWESKNFRNNGVTDMRTRQFSEDDQGGFKGRVKVAASNGGLTGNEDSSVEAKDQDSTDGQQSRDITRETTENNEASEDSDPGFEEPGNRAGYSDGDGNFFSKSGSTPEEDEEYKEEIDDPEF